MKQINFCTCIFALLQSAAIMANVTPVQLPAMAAQLHQGMIASGICESAPDTDAQAEHYDLGKGSQLALVPCITGAYQVSYNGYLTSNNGQTVSQVTILSLDENGKIAGTTNLSDASYDTKTKTLTTLSKGRSMGDCGISTVSQIVGDYFFYAKTTRIYSKPACDGKQNAWPVVFQQK